MIEPTPIQTVQEDALDLTEALLERFLQSNPLPPKDAMELRIQTFPLVAQYLMEDAVSYSAGLLVAKTLIEKFNTEEVQNTTQGYQISQNDLNDGLAKYSEHKEFAGIVSNLYFGRDGYGNPRAREPQEARKELVRIITSMASGKRPNARSLHNSVRPDETKHNHELLCYQARRILAIVKSQQGSFIPVESSKDNDKDDDVPVDGVSEISFPEQVTELLNDARRYRSVVEAMGQPLPSTPSSSGRPS